MKREIAEMIVDQGYDLQIYGDYSGRGMYGKTTTGIQTDDVGKFLEAVGQAFVDMISDATLDGENYDMTMAEDLQETLSDYKQDSLGMGYIIY